MNYKTNIQVFRYNDILKDKKTLTRNQWFDYIEKNTNKWVRIRCNQQKLTAIIKTEALLRYIDHLELDYKTLIVEPVEINTSK